jgi:hypothetical protein
MRNTQQRRTQIGEGQHVHTVSGRAIARRIGDHQQPLAVRSLQSAPLAPAAYTSCTTLSAPRSRSVASPRRFGRRTRLGPSSTTAVAIDSCTDLDSGNQALPPTGGVACKPWRNLDMARPPVAATGASDEVLDDAGHQHFVTRPISSDHVANGTLREGSCSDLRSRVRAGRGLPEPLFHIEPEHPGTGSWDLRSGASPGRSSARRGARFRSTSSRLVCSPGMGRSRRRRTLGFDAELTATKATAVVGTERTSCGQTPSARRGAHGQRPPEPVGVPVPATNLHQINGAHGENRSRARPRPAAPLVSRSAFNGGRRGRAGPLGLATGGPARRRFFRWSVTRKESDMGAKQNMELIEGHTEAIRLGTRQPTPPIRPRMPWYVWQGYRARWAR